MAKRMLIDATQAEETRVSVINGNRLDELDFEIASRKQLKGNIYLAKVTRVEPSLQAAFVEYGGNRQGFLAFAEIHPDYYKIPVADREKLLELEREEAEREAAEEEAELAAAAAAEYQPQPLPEEEAGVSIPAGVVEAQPVTMLQPEVASAPMSVESIILPEPVETMAAGESTVEPIVIDGEVVSEPALEGESAEAVEGEAAAGEPSPTEEGEEDVDRRKRAKRRNAILRQYKIQEVIKRNQIMLIQVVKEERGNKGAALTTYLSLAGRYCVLMPNTNRGGGVSRKISSLDERKRMKALLAELDMPQGMSIILRTAGLERSKVDIKRDLEYLTRLWDSIREKTLSSTAPSLIHEEANLIRRAIRDLYSREVSEIHVEGDVGYRTAKDFMRMMVPSAARRVHHYRDPAVPLFVRYRVESQIEALYSTTVNLRSGGYIVINQTEALVAIDVNSGRATRERNIEETALKTNLEAAEEIARQVRLRDLAGLVVIDFIDMEDQRHNTQVERRVRDAMKNDRARIQLGRISMFGLMELSRQRLRPSLIETNFSPCQACGGIGHVRSVESAALHVLRSIEEEGLQQKASELAVNVSEAVAQYLLNHKRAALSDVERRYGIKVFIHADSEIIKNAEHKIERMKARQPGEFSFPEPPPPIIEDEPPLPEGMEDDGPPEDDSFNPDGNETGDDDGIMESGDSEGRSRRRRRRGGRGRTRSDRPNGDRLPDVAQPGAPQPDVPMDALELQPDNIPVPDENGNYVAMTGHGPLGPDGQPMPLAEGEDRRRRRRGRRGGRGRQRGPREGNEGMNADSQPLADGEQPDVNGNIADTDANAAETPQGERRERGERGDRSERGDRGDRGRRRGGRGRGGERGGDRSERTYLERPPREPSSHPMGTPPAGGSSGGIRIISEFRGRNDPAPAQPSAVATPAPAAAPAASTATPPDSPDGGKPKTGWWKRLIGN